MGQQLHTQKINRKTENVNAELKFEHVDYSNIELLAISSDSNSSNLRSEDQSVFGMTRQKSTPSRESLEREEKLLQFVGEIIYYCKLYMKKQKKYHYKISAILFYKYFYDKFRQLLSKFKELYKKNEITLEEYEKRVVLVSQVKETFIKIKKIIYSKIPFLSEKTKSFLNENSEDYCFTKTTFFTELLYPEVQEILEFYKRHTEGEFDLVGINTCYIRMMKAVFIIQQLEFNNIVVKTQVEDSYPDYDIDKIEGWTEEQLQKELKQSYKILMGLKRS